MAYGHRGIWFGIGGRTGYYHQCRIQRYEVLLQRRIERDLLPLIQEVIIDYSNVPEARRLTHLPRGLLAGATQLKKITFAPGMKGVNKQVFPDSPEVQVYLPADWSYKNPETGALKFDIDRATESDFYKGRIHIVK